nr:MAG TPA: hypothetical protein [Caudoviricetes sp.]
MRINMNGTTITGSVSEVLATLTHLGIKASDTKPVTLPLVTEIAVTDADDVEKVARSIIAVMNEGETVTPEATPVPVPKPARDSVIKMAIDDVKDLLSRNYSSRTEVAKFVGETLWFVSEGGLYTVTDEVLFAVNADKRTVVASIRYNEDPKDVYKQGRAKCAPGDVFNEHIGKAIALRRALGLAVPVEYFEVEARDSDDLAVGDVVESKRFGYHTEITKMIDNPASFFASGSAFHHTDDKDPEGWLASSQVTLINDSARHTAPDLEVSRIIRH